MHSNLLLEIKPVVVAAGGVFVAVIFGRWLRRALRRRRLSANIEQFRTAERARRVQLQGRSSQPEISSLSLGQLAEGLKKGQLKAVDVLHTYQHLALESTKRTNAVTEFIVDSAEATAVRLDSLPADKRRPLHGVPVSVKENYFLIGTEATAGFSQYLGKFRDMETAPLVQFLQWQGCIPFVKTNIPQSLLSFDSRNPIYGLTRNPHNLNKSVGGSSGGEGAIVGAKASILGIGGDIGGSLRIPASWCGCVTLKPSSTRMLQGGTFPGHIWGRALVQDFQSTGFYTQDVDSLVMLHRLLYSPDTFKQFPTSTLAPVPFNEDLFSSASGPLTIGYCDFDGVIETVPSMKRAIDVARRVLEKRGHRLVKWQLPAGKEAFLLYIKAMAIDGSSTISSALEQDVSVSYPVQPFLLSLKTPHWIKALLALVGRPFVGELPADMVQVIQPGKCPQDINDHHQAIRQYRQTFAKSFEAASLNALLWPSFPSPTVPVDAPRDMLAAVTYSCLFNMLDWPAGTCPVTKVTAEDERNMASYPGDRDYFHKTIKEANETDTVGLPVSVQLVARRYQEEVVLRLMSEITTEMASH